MWTCYHCGTMRQRSIAVCSRCGFIRRVEDGGGVGIWRASRASTTRSKAQLACPLCQSTNMMNDIPVYTYRETSPYVEIPRKPMAMIFTDTERQHLHARICGNCGYTAFFAEEPQRLWAAYKQSWGRSRREDLDVDL